MTTCCFCGTAPKPGARVCTACGNVLAPDCATCGYHPSEPLVFCQRCGAPLGTLGTRRNGEYRLVRILGTGGIGRTYHALDAHGTHVALKEALADVRDRAKVKELFVREAIALNNLDHPAIPRLRDFFVEGDHRVQVMDLVVGTGLDQLARQAGGRLTENRVVSWMIELCEILEYLHSLGIVHRDIKPANLLVRRTEPNLVLIDFGAVKEAGSPPGTVIVTPGFAPYEQSQGIATAQSDLYAVGATIVALVVGVEPSNVYDAARAQFTNLEELGMSKSLSRLVGQLTAFQAIDRPSSARALKRVLLSVQ